MGVSGRIGIAAALFVSSAAGLVLEIVAARLIAPYVGMSVYTWTAIIAMVLAGMSAGHWIGGRLAETTDERALARVAVAFAAAAFNVLLIPLLLRWLAPLLFGGSSHILVAVTGLSAALFLVPSLLIAGASPILTRIALDAEPGRRGAVIGRMFALGAGGAILGTLAAGFVFISWIGSQGTLLAIAGVLGVLGAVFGVWAARARAARLALGLIVAAVVFGAWAGDRLLASACDRESRYYCIRVIDFSHETERESRLMVLDHMGHGINDRDDPTLLHSSYLDLTDTAVRLRFPGKRDLSSFFIGGGAYTLPRAWAVSYPGGRHVVAEIDPEVTALARERMWFEPSPAVEVHHADARIDLRREVDQAFDIVVGDAFHDISVPAHLVSVEFAREVRQKMRPDGLYVINVIDAAREPKFLLALLKTLFEVFPVVEIWGDTEQLGSGGRMTYLLAASARPLAASSLHSERFPDRRWVRVEPGRIAGSLRPDDLPVLSDDYAPVDRLTGAVAAVSR